MVMVVEAEGLVARVGVAVPVLDAVPAGADGVDVLVVSLAEQPTKSRTAMADAARLLGMVRMAEPFDRSPVLYRPRV